MSDVQPTVRNAAKLVYKALNTSLSPVNDVSYRELLALYRAQPNFASDVQGIAEGMELVVLDVSERGLVVAPISRESRFSARMADIRAVLKPEQKAALVLAHVAIAATFFPTTDGLDDDSYIAPPASLANFRDILVSLAKRLKEIGNDEVELPYSLEPGWEHICWLPLSTPSTQRSSPNTLTGLVNLSINQMREGGLIRLDRTSEDEAMSTYTPTHRFRVQLRELTLRRLFELAQTQTIAVPRGD